MNARNKNRDLQIILMCLNLLFLIILAFELTRTYELPPPAEEGLPGQDKTAAVTKPDDKLPALRTYNEIIKRPLFSPDRRPMATDTVVSGTGIESGKSVANPGGPKEYTLSAVIITGDKRLALIETLARKKTERLQEGEILDDWILTKIEPTRVSLKKGEEEKILELTVKPSPPQTTQNKPAPVNNTRPQKQGNPEGKPVPVPQKGAMAGRDRVQTPK